MSNKEKTQRKSPLFIIWMIFIWSVIGILLVEVGFRFYTRSEYMAPLEEFPELAERLKHTTKNASVLTVDILLSKPEDFPAPVYGNSGMNLPKRWTTFGKIEESVFYSKKEQEKSSENAIKILFAGGSTTYDGYPEYVEQLLVEKFGKKNIEIINMGLPASYTETSLVMMKRFLPKWQPDLVIIYHGFNDILSNIFNDISEKILKANNGTLDLKRFYEIQTPSSGLYDLLFKEKNNKAYGIKPLITENEMLTTYLKCVYGMIEYLNGIGVKYFFSSFAHPDYDNIDRQDFRFYDMTMRYMWPTMKTAKDYEKRITTYNCMMRTITNETGIPLLDIEPLLTSGREIFRDNCHRTEKGKKIHAEYVAKTISPTVEQLIAQKQQQIEKAPSRS